MLYEYCKKKKKLKIERITPENEPNRTSCDEQHIGLHLKVLETKYCML